MKNVLLFVRLWSVDMFAHTAASDNTMAEFNAAWFIKIESVSYFILLFHTFLITPVTHTAGSWSQSRDCCCLYRATITTTTAITARVCAHFTGGTHSHTFAASPQLVYWNLGSVCFLEKPHQMTSCQSVFFFFLDCREKDERFEDESKDSFFF